jgi:hypothetical protein
MNTAATGSEVPGVLIIGGHYGALVILKFRAEAFPLSF